VCGRSRGDGASPCSDAHAGLAYVAAPRTLVGADIPLLMQRAVATRFGAGERPDVPIATPAASPQSNGMSEAVVNILRRDYLAGADRSTAALVLDQIPTWLADYNTVAPHSALGFQAPLQYRKTMLTAGPMS
jgi:transposase InsO family protein